MSEDMNIIRFEMLIDEVGKKLHYNWGVEKKNDDEYSLLDYFFDSQKMNSYAKMIYNKASGCICYFPNSENEAFIRNSQIEFFSSYDIKNNIRSKIRAMKTFCKYYDFDENYEKLYALLFWSFMILTVDDSQKEEVLAKISDFLTLLGERKDMCEGITAYFNPKSTPFYITSVIKYLYHDDDYEDVYDGTSPVFAFANHSSRAVPFAVAKALSLSFSDKKIETYFITKGIIKKRGDTSATSNTWTCPCCGKIMPKYVGTCGCGESQPFSF